MASMSLVVSLLFILLAAASFCFQYIPYSYLKTYLDQMTSSGSAQVFTPLFFAGVVFKLKLLSLFFLSAAAVFYFRAKSISAFLSRFTKEVLEFLSALYVGLQKWKKETPLAVQVALLVLTILGAAIRAYYLAFPMRCDESFTFMHYSSRPFYVALANYSYLNNHIFHTLLVRISYLFFGDSAIAIRLPAFFAGTALIPCVYWLALQLRRESVVAHCGGLIAAALVACNLILIEYSANARGYSIFVLIVVLATGLLSKIIENDGAKKQNALQVACFFFALLNALGFYTMPLMLYPAVMFWVYWIVSKRKEWKLAILTGGVTVCLTLILYSPVLLTTGFAAIAKDKVLIPKPWPEFFQYLRISFHDFFLFISRDWGMSWVYVLIAFSVIGFLSDKKERKYFSLNGLVISFFVTALILMMLQRTVPHERSWLYLAPYLFLGAGFGFAGLYKKIYAKIKWVPLVSSVIIASVILCWNVKIKNSILLENKLREAEEIVNDLTPYLDGKTGIAVGSPLFEPLEYYFYKHKLSKDALFPDLSNHTKLYVLTNSTVERGPEGILNAMDLRKRFSGEIREIKSYPNSRMFKVELRTGSKDSKE